MTVQELHLLKARESKRDLMNREETYRKLVELLGIPEKEIEGKLTIEYESQDNELYDEIRFSFESEKDFFVPCHMILPKNRKGKLATVICIQGHSSGMHRSLGRVKYSGDTLNDDGDRDFAIQAVKRGYIAVIMEQRGFGELKGVDQDGGTNCYHMAMQALLLGRTLLGERVYDVTRLIDKLSEFEGVDMDRIGIMGNSGGGTTTFYASCIDSRIKVSMPSCSFCPYYDSILSIGHCSCNYIPSAYKYFDMEDLSALIAPRPFIVVAGIEDDIFPIEGTRRAFEKVKEIYVSYGVKDNCQLVEGPGGHRFYADLSWPLFDKYINN